MRPWLPDGGAMFPSHCKMYVAPIRSGTATQKHNDFEARQSRKQRSLEEYPPCRANPTQFTKPTQSNNKTFPTQITKPNPAAFLRKPPRFVHDPVSSARLSFLNHSI